MKAWLRRVRSAIGMGLTWAAGWLVLGAAVGLALGQFLDAPLAIVTTRFAILFGVLGFSAGAIFSTVLRLAERDRRFDELSLPRFAMWGTLGGLVLGALASAIGPGSGLTLVGAALLGGSSAVVSLVVARRADDPEALGAGDLGLELGITEDDAGCLPGTPR